MRERVILCGPVSTAHLPVPDRAPLQLRLWGAGRNIRLWLTDMLCGLWGSIPAAFRDVIHIAVYVYAADQALPRGSGTDQDLGDSWRRRLHFRIPVRCLEVWRDAGVERELVRTLSFLTEDLYHFEFEPLTGEPPLQGSFEVGDDPQVDRVDEVVLFSGGLDSLGGAVQESVVDGRQVLLVHHRSASKRVPRHDELLARLRAHARSHRPWHVPVRIDKARRFDRDFTQRSRSFLFAALGAALAVMVGRDRVRFYENGIVSINLPPSAQVVGARASRTTHPQVLGGYARLFSLLGNRPFAVENPFQWKTKAEVVELIARAGCADLIGLSTSCGHTWEMTAGHTHCGVCSQCIDRRFAVLAAGQAAADPRPAYAVDLLTGPRDEGPPRTMLAVYVEMASQIAQLSSAAFCSRYGEVTRVLPHVEGSRAAAALRVFELYRRHAEQVNRVVDQAVAAHASHLRQRRLPESCMIRLVTDASGGEVSAAGEREAEAGTASLEANVFRRKGKGWLARFAGGTDFLVLPSKGAAYLYRLLSNPGRAIPVVELACLVARHPQRYALGDAGELIDRDALTAYRARLIELDEDLEAARQNHDPGALEKLQAERQALLDQVRQAVGRRGLRKAANDRERVRQSVRAALRRVPQEIAESDPDLARHLSPPQLRCGWDPCYTPDGDRRWET